MSGSWRRGGQRPGLSSLVRPASLISLQDRRSLIRLCRELHWRYCLPLRDQLHSRQLRLPCLLPRLGYHDLHRLLIHRLRSPTTYSQSQAEKGRQDAVVGGSPEDTVGSGRCGIGASCYPAPYTLLLSHSPPAVRSHLRVVSPILSGPDLFPSFFLFPPFRLPPSPLLLPD
jgi:hypothetical protein